MVKSALILRAAKTFEIKVFLQHDENRACITITTMTLLPRRQNQLLRTVQPSKNARLKTITNLQRIGGEAGFNIRESLTVRIKVFHQHDENRHCCITMQQ